jgi:GTP-binding protein YchF
MLSIGLVGLPNAGKSSLFNLLTDRSVPAENFPFCTIDPTDGTVAVPDPRLEVLKSLVGASKIVPAMIEFRDIAGLVKNASQGAGLGNQFLSHIREVDLILLVVRCFKNDDIVHVENRVNPLEDEEILIMELGLHDQNIVNKQIQTLQKFKGKDSLFDTKIAACNALLKRIDGDAAGILELDEKLTKEIEYTKWRKSMNLLTDKKIVRLGNITQDGENLDYNSDFVLDVKLESELVDMTLEERAEFGYGVETGLDKLIRHCFEKLGLDVYLTAGEKEVRAWTFRLGMTAPQCAGVIHTDFEKKFICAEMVSYDDFVVNQSWKNCLEKGLIKRQGKEFVMPSNMVVEYKIGG